MRPSTYAGNRVTSQEISALPPSPLPPSTSLPNLTFCLYRTATLRNDEHEFTMSLPLQTVSHLRTIITPHNTISLCHHACLHVKEERASSLLWLALSLGIASNSILHFSFHVTGMWHSRVLWGCCPFTQSTNHTLWSKCSTRIFSAEQITNLSSLHPFWVQNTIKK